MGEVAAAADQLVEELRASTGRSLTPLATGAPSGDRAMTEFEFVEPARPDCCPRQKCSSVGDTGYSSPPSPMVALLCLARQKVYNGWFPTPGVVVAKCFEVARLVGWHCPSEHAPIELLKNVPRPLSLAGCSRPLWLPKGNQSMV